jgi:flagellar motor switch protein FliM
MSKILSQDEIEVLIASAPGVASRPEEANEPVVAYNFRRPDRVTKEQIRSLHFLHDRFAKNATTSLAAFLRTTTELSIVSVEQFSYSEFLMALPDPTAFYAFTMAPYEQLGALEVNPSVTFAMVDRLLGGSGMTGTPERALTEIEQNVVDSVVKLLLEHLTETWRVADVRFQIQGRETRPQMLQVVSWNEVVIVVAFNLKVGEVQGFLHICVPAGVIESSGTNFVQGFQQARREPTATEQRWLSENLGRVRLIVATDLQTQLKTRELLNLQPGQVLNLGVPVETDVRVRVGDLVKFKGTLAATAGRAAVVISKNCSSSPGACDDGQA